VLTEAEERAHFGLWAIMKSPIIMGTDMTKLKPSTLNIIKNKVTSTSTFPTHASLRTTVILTPTGRASWP
jgi:alpha-galactosidase